MEYNGLSEKMVKTTHLDISEHTRSKYDSDGHYLCSVADGYSLDQRVLIDLGMDNVLLNKLVRGIGKFVDGADINIGYTVKDPRPAQLRMLEKAVKDAKEKASHCTADSLDITPEDLSVNDTVQVEFELVKG